VNVFPAIPRIPSFFADDCNDRDVFLKFDVVDNFLCNVDLEFIPKLLDTLPQCFWGMTMQTLCSEEACEIIMTFTPTRASAEKIRAEIPGTPTMPLPSIETRLKLSMEVMFFTNRSADCVDCEINVPGCDGLKVFFILIGIFFRWPASSF